MIAKNIITETEATIAWYKPPMKIRHAMRKLAKTGFYLSGYGNVINNLVAWGFRYDFDKNKYIHIILDYNTKTDYQRTFCSLIVNNDEIEIGEYDNLEPKIGAKKAISLRNELMKNTTS